MSDNTTALRVLIADDEVLARTRIRRLMTGLSNVEIIGEAANGDELQQLLPMLRPDLLLLDIEMPGSDVFETLTKYATTASVSIVFITAHDHYALKAFDVEAIDFLLKPISADRLGTAIARARRRGAVQAAVAPELAQVVRAIKSRQRELESSSGTSAQRYAERMLVRVDGAEIPILVSSIESFEASHNGVGLRTQTGVYSIRGTLSAVEASLDPDTFARIHRGIIVNLDHVKQVQPWFWGDAIVTMKRGARLRMSRRYREAFHNRFLAATRSNPRAVASNRTKESRSAARAPALPHPETTQEASMEFADKVMLG